MFSCNVFGLFSVKSFVLFVGFWLRPTKDHSFGPLLPSLLFWLLGCDYIYNSKRPTLKLEFLLYTWAFTNLASMDWINSLLLAGFSLIGGISFNVVLEGGHIFALAKNARMVQMQMSVRPLFFYLFWECMWASWTGQSDEYTDIIMTLSSMCLFHNLFSMVRGDEWHQRHQRNLQEGEASSVVY